MKRTAVITGSASGIGKATRELLLARGYRVIGVDLHDAEIIGRYGQPEEVAELIALLVSPENSLMVGQVIYIDSGSEAMTRGELGWVSAPQPSTAAA